MCHNTTTTTVFEFRLCPGIVDPRRGYGLTQAFVHCLDRARADAANENDAPSRSSNDTTTVTIILEDDARLFDTSFCQSAHRQRLWQAIPSDAMVILLGGHQFQYDDETNPLNDSTTTTNTNDAPRSETSSSSSLFQPTTFSYGTYGFAVPNHRLQVLRDGYAQDLTATQHKTFWHPDVSWYEHAHRNQLRIYKANPLVVWHAEGYSNSWGGWRDAIRNERPDDPQQFSSPSSLRETEWAVGTPVLAYAVDHAVVYHKGTIVHCHKEDWLAVVFQGEERPYTMLRRHVSDQKTYSTLHEGQMVIVYRADDEDFHPATVQRIRHSDNVEPTTTLLYDVQWMDDNTTLKGIKRNRILAVSETTSTILPGQAVLALWDERYYPATVTECHHQSTVYDVAFTTGPVSYRENIPRHQIKEPPPPPQQQ